MSKKKKKIQKTWAEKRDEQATELITGEPIWIHDKQSDPESVTGYFSLPGCTCGVCGYHSNMEKPICPRCKSEMKGSA